MVLEVGGRLGSELDEMHRTVIIFMFLEVRGEGCEWPRKFYEDEDRKMINFPLIKSTKAWI